jgi:hypothetical protein
MERVREPQALGLQMALRFLRDAIGGWVHRAAARLNSEDVLEQTVSPIQGLLEDEPGQS